MAVEKYLARIGCSGPCPLTLETLRYVHLNHLMTVPFENLTIHIGERNNGLFSWLLSQRGFDVTILSAQVRNRFTNAYGPPFDHFIMMVRLCDVWFGSGFQLPLSLETDSPQVQSHGVYRLRAQGNLIFMEMNSEGLEENVGRNCTNSPWSHVKEMISEPCMITIRSVLRQQAIKTTTDLSDEEITELLRKKFGIVLHSPLTPKDYIYI
uniref:arylamine N-acetyltransferase n=1 Tax=Sinocyclocheilus anshuiensis TaxID=1608454 RepID=A0A671RVH6_9TELE